jgi:hypothetical protein
VQGIQAVVRPVCVRTEQERAEGQTNQREAGRAAVIEAPREVARCRPTRVRVDDVSPASYTAGVVVVHFVDIGTVVLEVHELAVHICPSVFHQTRLVQQQV